MADTAFKPDITLKDLYGPSTDEEKSRSATPHYDPTAAS